MDLVNILNIPGRTFLGNHPLLVWKLKEKRKKEGKLNSKHQKLDPDNKINYS
jgi:hypothetical protein